MSGSSPIAHSIDEHVLNMWYDVADQLSPLALRVVQSTGEMTRTDKTSSARTALACLIAKGRLDFQAMLMLSREGHHGPARVLARTVMDSCVTALYIANDPESRAEQFWQHEIQQRVDLGKKVDNLKPLPPSSVAKLTDWHRFIQVFDGPNKKRGRLAWPNVGDMIPDLKLDIEDLLSTIYKQYSYDVHALPFALVNGFVQYRGDAVRVSPEPREADRVTPVFVTSFLFYLTLQVARNAFRLSIDDSLADIHTSIEQIQSYQAEARDSKSES